MIVWYVVVTSGSGGGGFAGASSYRSSGPHLALSRPGLWLYWLLLPLPSRFLRPSRAPASLPSHGTRTDEDGFIVNGADEAGLYRLVQWILDGWEVAYCHLSDPIAVSSVDVCTICLSVLSLASYH